MTVPIVGMEGICDQGTEAVKDLPGELTFSVSIQTKTKKFKLI